MKVIFDAFNKHDFEEAIVSAFEYLDNIEWIEPCDSQLNPGLQFADNICSTIRLHLSDRDERNYYSLIEDMTHEV